MHKINLEEDFKAIVQPQRILNLVMKEEIQKKVVKLLEARIKHIYDSINRKA